MPSTVPDPVLTPSGFITPDDAVILQAVLKDVSACFGGALNPALNTPQGQLATTLAASIASKNATFLEVVSQVDPNYARGRMQDGLGYIYMMERLPAVSTQVVCLCGGGAGVVIPKNAQVKADDGTVYYCAEGGVVGPGGTVSLVFKAVVPGPVECPAGTLNAIRVGVPGWDTVTNPTAGTVGRDVETPQQFEWRRRQSVALNAQGMLAAVRAAVLASGSDLTPPQTPVDVLCVENRDDVARVVNGVTMRPHSVYVAVVGGEAASIGSAIWSRLGNGCGFTPSASFTASVAAGTATMTVSSVASGTLASGQTVLFAGATFPDGTKITGQVSGTPGGAGVYQLSASVAGGVPSQAGASAAVYLKQDTSYPPPCPTYPVLWTVPLNQAVDVGVTLAEAGQVPSNALALLTSALSEAFSGADGGQALRTGGTVYASRFYATVAAALPASTLLDVRVGTGGGAPTASSVALRNDQYPVLGAVSLVLA